MGIPDGEARRRVEGAGTTGQNRDRPARLPSSLLLGLGLWAAALAAVASAGLLRNPGEPGTQLLCGASALLALVGAALVDRRAPLREPDFAAPTDRKVPGDRPSPPLGWKVAGAALLLAALPATGLSVYLAAGRTESAAPLWLWLFALAALPVGLNFGVRNPLHLARPKADAESAMVLGILALAAALRLSGPDSPPPQLQAGNTIYSPGTASLVEGLLSLLLLQLTARRLFPLRVAVTALLLLAVNPWHVRLSQTGFPEMPLLLAPLLLFYLLLRALDSRRSIEYLLAGYAAGLCLALPSGTHLALGAAVLYLLHRATVERGFSRVHAPGLLLTVLGASVLMAPVAAFYGGLPSDLLSGATVQHFELIGSGSPLVGSDPPLDLWAWVVAVPGIAMATVRLHRSRYFLLALGVWLPVASGFVVKGAFPSGPWPFALPFVALAAALFLEVGGRAATALVDAGSMASQGARPSP